jgi:AhpD family alkylhydroperoxidase
MRTRHDWKAAPVLTDTARDRHRRNRKPAGRDAEGARDHTQHDQGDGQQPRGNERLSRLVRGSVPREPADSGARTGRAACGAGNKCDYCLSAHTYIATKRAGLTEAEATHARHGKAAHLTAAAALGVAAALVRNHGTVTDDELAAARTSGLSDGHIAEIVAYVALNVFTNYFNTAARVPIDWPLVRHTG